MSKSIKIDDNVYKDLDDYRAKGETFSQALAKLLSSARHVVMAKDALGDFIPVIRSSSYTLAPPVSEQPDHPRGNYWDGIKEKGE